MPPWPQAVAGLNLVRWEPSATGLADHFALCALWISRVVNYVPSGYCLQIFILKRLTNALDLHNTFHLGLTIFGRLFRQRGGPQELQSYFWRPLRRADGFWKGSAAD